MNIDDFKEAANNPNFISGIYNYCDRWCERCSFTSRCMLASVDNSSEPTTDKEVFESVKKSFEIALELLHEWAEKEGINLDEIEDTQDERDFEKQRRETDKHPLCQVSKKYVEMLNDFLNNNKESFIAEQEDLVEKVNNRLLPPETLEQAKAFKEAMEVVRWYHFQIYVKLTTAARGVNYDPDYEDEIQFHGNGCAKVSLLGTERSIAALGVMLQLLPELEDEILPLLVQLERTRQCIKQYFPKVEQFKRPGFDD